MLSVTRLLKPICSDRLVQLVQIEIEIFKLRAPAASPRPFNAGTGRSPSPQVPDARHHGCCGNAGHRDGVIVFDFSKCYTASSVEQEHRRSENTKSDTRWPEPRQLMLGKQSCRGNLQQPRRRAALLT